MLAIPAVLDVHGLDIRRRQDQCHVQCNDIYSAVTICESNIACLCPTILASAAVCSSCLVSLDADPAEAALLESAYASCQLLPTAEFTFPKTASTTVNPRALTSTIGLQPTQSQYSPNGFGQVFGAVIIHMIIFIGMIITLIMFLRK